MKRITIATLLAIFSFTTASAEVGVNVGISGQMGLFAASATETDKGTHGTTTDGNEQNRESDYIGLGYTSVFIEKTLGDRLFIGVDYVPDVLATETNETVRHDQNTSDNLFTQKTNTVQVDFKDLTTAYIGVSITDSLYAKIGMMNVDIITNETLGTGSSYGNTDMDGTVAAVGYHMENDSGVFFRAEGSVMDFDGADVTSANGVNKITLDKLDGASAKISVGKAF